MKVHRLIDEIVRQTTVLIAQLSTSAGLRAPLSRIADQVFLELARELDAQGVRRKVAADMFGMALRSYQTKVRRLTESNDRPEASLWQALYGRLGRGSATRAELEDSHHPHSADQIGAVLQDMVQSGVAYSSGRGRETLFGLTSSSDRSYLDARREHKSLRDLAWYFVASGSAGNVAELAEQLGIDPTHATALVEELRVEGFLKWDDQVLRARRFELDASDEQGWETSVLDHFRAVTTAVAAKVSRPVSPDDDRIGGGTRSFLVYSGHPEAETVYRLLSETRTRTRELWRRVSEFNEATPPPEHADRVTFYFGQHVVRSHNAVSEEEGNG